MMRQPLLTIPLGVGPDQATAKLLRDGTQVVETTLNGQVDKAGGLRKARGYTRIALTTTTEGGTPEAVFEAVGTDRDELVLVGHDYTYAVAANSAAVDGAALVLRGPTLRGAFEIETIHGSPIGDGV